MRDNLNKNPTDGIVKHPDGGGEVFSFVEHALDWLPWKERFLTCKNQWQPLFNNYLGWVSRTLNPESSECEFQYKVIEIKLNAPSRTTKIPIPRLYKNSFEYSTQLSYPKSIIKSSIIKKTQTSLMKKDSPSNNWHFNQEINFQFKARC